MKGVAWLCAGVAVCGVSVVGAGARQAPQDDAVFRAASDLVLVPASVTDQGGHFVPNMTPNDFLLFEDDAPRPIAQFTEERVPLSVGIVLDASGSMQGDRIAVARFALQQFVGLLEPGDEIFLQTFAERSKLVLPWTTRLGDLDLAMDTVDPYGGSAMFRAVSDAYGALTKGQHVRKALVLLSDGNDNERSAIPLRLGSGSTRDDALTIRRLQAAVGQAQRSGTVVYAIGLGSERGNGDERIDSAKLRRLTDPTGGYTEVVGSVFSVPGAMMRIAADLRQQYLIGFQSVAPGDGRTHRIRLAARSEGLRVRARSVFVAGR